MPIIQSSQRQEKKQLIIRIESDILEKIKQYCAWAGVNKHDDFFVQAAEFVLSKDKEWIKYTNEQTST